MALWSHWTHLHHRRELHNCYRTDKPGAKLCLLHTILLDNQDYRKDEAMEDRRPVVVVLRVFLFDEFHKLRRVDLVGKVNLAFRPLRHQMKDDGR